MNLSVLQKAKKEDIDTTYFPLLVIKNALPEELYNELEQTFPNLNIFEEILNKKIDKNNFAYRIQALKALDSSKITTLWKDFIKYHTSKDFFQEIINLFGEYIRDLHPNFEKHIKKSLEDTNIKVRKISKISQSIDMNKSLKIKEELSIDCQFVINSPVLTSSNVIEHHLDMPNELFACLFYMKKDEDNFGGDLEIYKHLGKKRKTVHERKSRWFNKYILEKVRTIPYEKNTLVFFINCPNALHAVSYRKKTNICRRYISILGKNYNGFEFC